MGTFSAAAWCILPKFMFPNCLAITISSTGEISFGIAGTNPGFPPFSLIADNGLLAFGGIFPRWKWKSKYKFFNIFYFYSIYWFLIFRLLHCYLKVFYYMNHFDDCIISIDMYHCKTTAHHGSSWSLYLLKVLLN